MDVTGGVDEDVRELISDKSVLKHSTSKAWVLLLLFPICTQLSIPNTVCLHFSVTHRSTVAPVAPPPSNHRAAPLRTAKPGFQSCDSNPLQLNKTGSENRGVGGYLTGESNYNWHLNTRQTAGNLTLNTVQQRVQVTVLKWFGPNRSRQVREVLTKSCWLMDNHSTQLIYAQPCDFSMWSFSNSAQLDTCGLALDHKGIGVT